MMPQIKQEEAVAQILQKNSGLESKDDMWHPTAIEAVTHEHPTTKHQVPFNGLMFHNPFDVNSYPLTNPPLYDPTAMLAYGAPGPRRRRISISNGQIGQIVNHEAFYVDDDSFDGCYDSSSGGYRAPGQESFSEARAATGSPADAPAGNVNGAVAAPVAVPVPAPAPAVAPSAAAAGVNVGGAGGDEHTHSLVAAGLPPPNHSLIYNNEVIYNPNDGPIPGTAAWKKERLLERNRVAASKCRQRKKQAQQQLQNSMAQFRKEIKEKSDKLQRAEKLLKMYNSALQLHFQGNGAALETLRPFLNKSPDEVFGQL